MDDFEDDDEEEEEDDDGDADGEGGDLLKLLHDKAEGVGAPARDNNDVNRERKLGDSDLEDEEEDDDLNAGDGSGILKLGFDDDDYDNESIYDEIRKRYVFSPRFTLLLAQGL